MRRVHAHEGRPYCVIDIYLDAEIFARHPTRFREETVIPLLMAMPSVKIVDRAPGADDLDRRPRGRAPSRHATSTRRSPRCGASSPGPRRRVIYLGEVTYRGDFVHIEFDLKA